MKKFVLIFALSSTGLLVVLTLSLSMLYVWDPFATTCWHIFHRGEYRVESYTFTMPPLWRPMSGRQSNELALFKHARLGFLQPWVPEFVVIRDSVKTESQTLGMQQKVLTGLNRGWPGHPDGLNATAETIHAASLNFYCEKTVEPHNFVSLDCQAPGVDWVINVAGASRDVRQAEQIIQSIH